jgi:hypothetical protein
MKLRGLSDVAGSRWSVNSAATPACALLRTSRSITLENQDFNGRTGYVTSGSAS